MNILMNMLLLLTTLVVSVRPEAPLQIRRQMVMQVSEDAVDQPIVLPVYASILAGVGCVATLRKLPTGEVVFHACPTWTCGYNSAGNLDECQGISGSSGLFVECKCRDNGWSAVKCRAPVFEDETTGEVAWDCFTENCSAGCEKQDPPPGPGFFSACKC